MAPTPKPYDGMSIRIYFDAARCIHAAECVKGAPGVFRPASRPWITPDGDSPDAIAATIHRCPSGALTFERVDGGPSEPVPDQNTIALSPNGPLYVRGRIKVSSASGQALFDGSRVALCRCGASKRKPFCDGAHEAVRFADPGQVASLPTTTADVASGVLEITPSTNGPLLLKGAYRVLAAGADPSEPLGKGALCRCGQSQSRPFCDGSHTRVGFSAE